MGPDCLASDGSVRSRLVREVGSDQHKRSARHHPAPFDRASAGLNQRLASSHRSRELAGAIVSQRPLAPQPNTDGHRRIVLIRRLWGWEDGGAHPTGVLQAEWRHCPASLKRRLRIGNAPCGAPGVPVRSDRDVGWRWFLPPGLTPIMTGAARLPSNRFVGRAGVHLARASTE
jgi:hypothetical protein